MYTKNFFIKFLIDVIDCGDGIYKGSIYKDIFVIVMKGFFEDLISSGMPGPRPSFSIFDIVKTLMILAEFGSIGRGKLSEKLSLGGGAVRTLLSRLSEAGLISISRSGCTLTEEGKRLYREVKRVIPKMCWIGPNELTFAEYNVIVQVRGGAGKVRKGIEQRDAAVRAGAKGAITLIYRNNKLIMPAITKDVSKSYPVAYQQIIDIIDFSEEDVAIIVCANDPRSAEYGALAAAWTII